MVFYFLKEPKNTKTGLLALTEIKVEEKHTVRRHNSTKIKEFYWDKPYGCIMLKQCHSQLALPHSGAIIILGKETAKKEGETNGT